MADFALNLKKGGDFRGVYSCAQWPYDLPEQYVKIHKIWITHMVHRSTGVANVKRNGGMGVCHCVNVCVFLYVDKLIKLVYIILCCMVNMDILWISKRYKKIEIAILIIFPEQCLSRTSDSVDSVDGVYANLGIFHLSNEGCSGVSGNVIAWKQSRVYLTM
jgi:hypothetical protein